VRNLSKHDVPSRRAPKPGMVDEIRDRLAP